MIEKNIKHPIHKCMVCSVNDAVLRVRLLELCFNCSLDSIEPIEPGWGVALELKAEGYDLGDDDYE
jgi:hypothetical protein